MSWTDFYLICFFWGFVLSLLSLLGSLHVHLPHFDFHLGGDMATRHTHGGTDTGEHAVDQFGNGRGVSGLVRRHRLSARPLF